MAPSVPTAFTRWRNVCRAVIPFLFTALVFSAGLLLFVRGFFLTRTQLDIATYHSTCSCRPVNDLWGQRDGSIMSMCVPSPAVSDDTNQCWGPEAPDVQRHRFSKVVLLVVDALRFDFVLPSCSGVGDGGANVTGSDGDLAWQGQLPIFEELLRRQPDRAVLYRASADPPTVTQQRLKALVAGGMPTFMDVRDSFASPRITEDNLVAQAAAQGWRFVGVAVRQRGCLCGARLNVLCLSLLQNVIHGRRYVAQFVSRVLLALPPFPIIRCRGLAQR